METNDDHDTRNQSSLKQQGLASDFSRTFGTADLIMNSRYKCHLEMSLSRRECEAERMNGAKEKNKKRMSP
jgi:hypothetical protein